MIRYALSPFLLAANRILPGAAARRDGLRILMFHDIPKAQMHGFEQFVEYVKQNYPILSPDKAAKWISERDHGQAETRPCLFTFDDGFKSNFRVAGEILDRHDIKALFFICPGLVDLEGDDQRDRIAADIHDGRISSSDLAKETGLMSWDEIKQLHERGHRIGAHGISHKRLSKLDGRQLRREIVCSGERLKEMLGVDIPWYAYAFGDISSISEQALKIIAENYQFCRSGVRGGNHAGVSPFALRADQMDPTAPLSYMKFTMEGGLDYRYREVRHHLDKITLKR